MGRRITNIKKWVKTFIIGIPSALTLGCFCGGCCGKIPFPEKPHKNKAAVMSQWFETGSVAGACLPMACGFCCGKCGEWDPDDVIEKPTRCEAITKSGRRCKISPLPQSNFCQKHQ
jgi:hypothetical protein